MNCYVKDWVSVCVSAVWVMCMYCACGLASGGEKHFRNILAALIVYRFDLLTS